MAKPSPSVLRYGGNTSCVEVRTDDGALIVIDCGTGAHDLGQALVEESGNVRGSLLISHTHWDHIQGIPFFAPFFAPEHEWDVYAPHNMGESIRETLAGQMRYTYFPVSLEALGANIRYHDLVEGSFEIGKVTVHTRYLNHPALTLGYRLEADGVAMVYSCDHEQYASDSSSKSGELGGQNLRHVEFLRGADLVIHDAQYIESEYAEKVGWGHSTAEYAVEVCRAAGVRQLALTHHDPLRSDDEVDRIVSVLSKELQAKGESLRIFGAAEGQTINLQGSGQRDDKLRVQRVSATAALTPDIAGSSILLTGTDQVSARLIADAATAEKLRLVATSGVEDAVAAVDAQAPSLVIIDEQSGVDDASSICRKVRELASGDTPQPPIVVLAVDDLAKPSLVPYTTDRLIKPFSIEYMRTRLRAWVMRRNSRWMRAPRPDNEESRLTALHALGILDTEPEERFDRIVREVAAALDVPVALVSLVDDDRQWFKACLGLDAAETPRDMSFCAHAVVANEFIMVPDTLLDHRFAENPLVTGKERIRFYAGCPLSLPDGHVMGTLCVIDSRPRELDGRQTRLLKEFARQAEAELAK